jgi:hypothetical protein
MASNRPRRTTWHTVGVNGPVGAPAFTLDLPSTTTAAELFAAVRKGVHAAVAPGAEVEVTELYAARDVPGGLMRAVHAGGPMDVRALYGGPVRYVIAGRPAASGCGPARAS